MSIRSITFSEGEYYHLYNRGNAKRTIFLDEKDYERFLQLLRVCNSTKHINIRDLPEVFDPGAPLIAIGAYCLMPNHFHLLVKEITPNGISIFMQKMSTAYVMYFNKKYEVSGSLFEGKFKARHIDNDRYLRYCYAYIHLNPIKLLQKDWKEKGIRDKKNAFQFLDTYRYSSYHYYHTTVGHPSTSTPILSFSDFPHYFLTATEHQRELLSWLTYIEPLGLA